MVQNEQTTKLLLSTSASLTQVSKVIMDSNHYFPDKLALNQQGVPICTIYTFHDKIMLKCPLDFGQVQVATG